MNLLEVQNLSVHFPLRTSSFKRAVESVRAVDGVSFSIRAAETVGLVGESGCGKSTLSRAVVRLIPPTGGKILFEGDDMASFSNSGMRSCRRRLQMIFQDPYGSLNPRMTASDSIGEGLDIHGLAQSSAAREAMIARLLEAVGLDSSHAGRYPHQFSGGQRQRIGIARALAVEPSLIVCDEPVSALDVSIQAQIINLLQDLQSKLGIAYLFVAHDIAVVEHISHRVLVMYLGRIVESGDAKAVCRSPKHPYTQALLSSVPVLDPDSKRPRIMLGGDVPSPIHPPSGCPFHPRCPVAESRCQTEAPKLREISEGRQVACHLAT